MTEWWVSKKNYWCKYCNIWIRDDAPSRKQHETGLKHIGNRERYIRDIYKEGNTAKREKEQEAAEIARIERSAAAAHSGDVSTGYKSRPSILAQIQSASAAASSSRPKAPSKPVDKYANYSNAAQLGFDDEDTKKSTFEIEQEIKGRGTHVGAWETVEEGPHGAYTPPTGDGTPPLGKRPFRDPTAPEEDEGETFKFEHRDEIKKRGRDLWAEDDWDPSALKAMKKKASTARGSGIKEEHVKQEVGGLDRTAWTGKIELNGEPSGSGQNAVKLEGTNPPPPPGASGSGWVKVELADQAGDVNPEDIKPALPAHEVQESSSESASNKMFEQTTTVKEEEAPQESTSLFKKRRPPPSSRKK